jgi:hypothetical protein
MILESSIAMVRAVNKKPRKNAVTRQPETSSEEEIWMARIHGGAFPDYLNKQLQAKYGIPLCFLTDKQWGNIRDLGALRCLAI